MKADEIGENELSKAIAESLQGATEKGPDYIGFEPGTTSLPVVVREFGISRNKAKMILRAMVESGILKRDIVRYVDDWGYPQGIRGYRFVGEEDYDSLTENGSKLD